MLLGVDEQRLFERGLANFEVVDPGHGALHRDRATVDPRDVL